MYTGIPYGSFLNTPACRVSVDNVRLKFQYRGKSYDFEKNKAVDTLDFFSHLLDRLWFDHCDIVWSRCDPFKVSKYMRTCTISGTDAFNGDWSCAVLIGRYGFSEGYTDPETGEIIPGRKMVFPEIVFDFNPNKVPDYMFSKIVSILRDGSLSHEIQRFDVAFDFPLSRDCVTLIRNNVQSYKLYRDAKTGAVTEYQGERSNHAAMKLYDKTKEHGLTVPVTRCEITVKGDYRESLEKLFPSLSTFVDLQIGIDFTNLPFAVQACIRHPDLIPTLKATVDPKTWRKYKTQITTYGNVSLSPGNWKDVDRFVGSTLVKIQGGAL